MLTTNDYDYDDYSKLLRVPAESGEQGGVGVTGDTGAGDESTSTGL